MSHEAYTFVECTSTTQEINNCDNCCETGSSDRIEEHLLKIGGEGSPRKWQLHWDLKDRRCHPHEEEFEIAISSTCIGSDPFCFLNLLYGFLCILYLL